VKCRQRQSSDAGFRIAHRQSNAGAEMRRDIGNPQGIISRDIVGFEAAVMHGRGDSERSKLNYSCDAMQ